MIVETATIDVTQYTVQYELLRSQVIVPTGTQLGETKLQTSHVALASPCS